MAIEIIMDWLQATLRWAAPLLIVAVGEVYAERSGVINMGIEGIMLFGALTGIAAGCHFYNCNRGFYGAYCCFSDGFPADEPGCDRSDD